jgi:hypothetical protein
METQQTSDTIAQLTARAKQHNQFWAVVRHGRRTRKIIGKYDARAEAQSRIDAYRGKVYGNKRYIVG